MNQDAPPVIESPWPTCSHLARRPRLRAERTPLAIVVTSQGCGLTLLVLSLPLLPEATPAGRDLVWGGAAGLAAGTGVTLLYRALAVGRMAVVAPTTAVCAVMIPVVTGVLLGERLVPLTILGVALVSQQEAAAGSASVQDGALPPGVGLALQSGVAIGLFFLALAETDAQAGMWPLVAARAVSVTLFGVIALVSARPLRMAAPVARDRQRRRTVPVGYPLWAAQRRRHPVIAVPREYRDPCPDRAWRAPQWVAGHRCGVRSPRGRAHRQFGMTTGSACPATAPSPQARWAKGPLREKVKTIP